MFDSDPLLASLAAQQKYHLGAYREAIEASDTVIASMLRRPMAIDHFVQACARARRPPRLLRYRPTEVLQLAHLRQALVIRWNALHQLGDHHRAEAMRRACQRLFPRQRSIPVIAGNHALDRNEVEAAKGHFEAAIALDPAEVGAISGLAIVNEMQKNWPAALVLRKQAAELSDAFAREDAASLHRVIRYAAALGRLQHWQEAGPWFRRCVRRGAFEKLPQERAVLLQAFSGPLYSPGMVIAMLSGERPGPDVALPPQLGDAVARCLRDAEFISTLTAVPFLPGPDATADQAQAIEALLSGMRAWALGDPEAAYYQFNRADFPGARSVDDREMCAHYLLLRSAQATAATETQSIAAFALARAQAVLASGDAGDEARLYADLTMLRLSSQKVDADRLIAKWLLNRSPTLDTDIGSLRVYVASLELCAALAGDAGGATWLHPQPYASAIRSRRVQH